VSTIDLLTYQRSLPHCRLEHSSSVVKAYNGGRIKFRGKNSVLCEVEGRSTRGHSFVVGVGENIVGLDILKKLDMTIYAGKSQCRVHNDERESLLRIEDKCLFEGIGYAKQFTHRIKTRQGAVPKQQKLRRLPLTVRDKVKFQLVDLERQGIIERIESSEWVSPIVVATRKSGDIRVCVDLREVNKAIITDSFPLPHFKDLLCRLSNARVFSKIDLKSAYHQIPLAEESRDMTCFITHWGLDRNTRVCFGLASTPSDFQRITMEILNGLENVICYLDDVLVYAPDRGSHDRILSEVLNRIRACGLTLYNKCIFGVSSIQFLGYEVNEQGIRPSMDNIEALMRLPTPQNLTQLRAFLGMSGFYLRCVKDYAVLVEPLREVLRCDGDFKWEERQNQAFDRIKQEIKNAEPLAVFDANLPTMVITNASNYGVGAVLGQMHKTKFRPVAFASATFSETQRRYSTGDKEALACLWAVEKWRVYLWGRAFKMITDHSALVSLFGKSDSTRRSLGVASWAERLSNFSYTMEYRRGSENVVADALSRMPLSATEAEVDTDDEIIVGSIEQVLAPFQFAYRYRGQRAKIVSWRKC